MPVGTDEGFVVESERSELHRRAIDVVGRILVAGILLETRFKSLPNVLSRLFERPIRSGRGSASDDLAVKFEGRP